ncbi:MAG TPA: tetratricopeptide repeat protein [Bryobacteraceae bacterium]|jgi:tetratricopeptide (TPR) repeat protein
MSITKIMPFWALAVAAAAHAQPHSEQLRDLYQQHLAEEQRDHGEFDARTAEAARDLGLFFRGHNDPQSAHDALTHAVAIDEKVFGPDAPRTLADVADLATVSPASEAPRLFERAAKSSDAAAASRALLALGEMRASQDDHQGAARFWRQALAKQEAAAPDSPNAAMILNVLAQVVEPAEAIPLLHRALALDRKIYGAGHPETGGVDQLLAQSLLATGKAADAVAPAGEAFSILSTKLGLEHPRTASAADTLADAFRATAKFAEAERYYRQALAIDEKILGPQHPTTLENIRNLAAFLRRRGKVNEAIVLERRLVVNVAR